MISKRLVESVKRSREAYKASGMASVILLRSMPNLSSVEAFGSMGTVNSATRAVAFHSPCSLKLRRVIGTEPVISSWPLGAELEGTGATVSSIVSEVRLSTRTVTSEPRRPKSKPLAEDSLICAGA